MDDTLVDWSHAISTAVGNAVDVLGLSGERLASRSLHEEICAYTWRFRDGLVVGRAHGRLYLEPGVAIDRAFPDRPAALRRQAAHRFRDALVPSLHPDVLPALDALRDVPAAVLSNNALARVTLQRLGIFNRFLAVTIPDDPYRKPHGEAFAQGCRLLGFPSGDVAFVGSGIANDIEGAMSAGLSPVIWVDRFRDRYPAPPPSTRIQSLRELADFL